MPPKKAPNMMKREVIFNRLLKLESYVLSILDNTSTVQLGEIKTRLSVVKRGWDEFDEIQSAIEAELTSTKLEEQRNERDRFETLYFRVVGAAEDVIEAQAGITAVAQNLATPPQLPMDPELRLPPIQLPTFNGAYDEWHSFFNIFKDIVHSNGNYRNSSKLKYLKNSLRGEAYSIIDSLDLTCENYQVALDLLIERYDDPNRAIEKHTASLFDLPKLERESASSLRSLLDNSQKHLRALKGHGQPTDSWDTLIVHLISSKFDAPTFQEWKKATPAKTLPTAKQLFEFLETRCRILDSISAHTSHSSLMRSSQFTDSYNTKSAPPGAKRPSRCFVAESNEVSFPAVPPCIICSQPHLLNRCERFLGMSTDQRFEFVKSKYLCINCLRGNHRVADCRSSHCQACQKTHHTLLHREIPPIEPNPMPSHSASPGSYTKPAALDTHPSTTIVKQDTSSLVSSSPNHANPFVLLSTAKVFVHSPEGKRFKPECS
ncbi:Retrotransposon protein [Nesidiocoris tenuis]|uniref:Retrotransposon protein n=1 Tax=Nesidiocoris tenuis TaxID=355587 RepID=A0ABN7ABP6_9HEMI|nr:Retrotransposon protein [Nesidiocoris tenuis]